MKTQAKTSEFKWWTSLGILGMALACLVAGWLFALDDTSMLVRDDALIASIIFGAIAAYTAICQATGCEIVAYRFLRKVAKIAVCVWPVMIILLAIPSLIEGDYWSLVGYSIWTTLYVGFPAFLIIGFVESFIPKTSKEIARRTEQGSGGNGGQLP